MALFVAVCLHLRFMQMCDTWCVGGGGGRLIGGGGGSDFNICLAWGPKMGSLVREVGNFRELPLKPLKALKTL